MLSFKGDKTDSNIHHMRADFDETKNESKLTETYIVSRLD